MSRYNPRRLAPIALALPLSLLLAAVFALPAFADDAPVQSYGEGSGEGELVAIADILADPDAWQGKTVRVEGSISGVCPKAGCWMELVDAENASLRIKVEDGVIVFPEEAVGKKAIARGEVKVMDMERDRWVAWQRHLAEELGETFDEASVGEGPFRMVQIAGVGAEIEG